MHDLFSVGVNNAVFDLTNIHAHLLFGTGEDLLFLPCPSHIPLVNSEASMQPVKMQSQCREIVEKQDTKFCTPLCFKWWESTGAIWFGKTGFEDSYITISISLHTHVSYH